MLKEISMIDIYALVKCSNSEMFIGEVINNGELSIILANPLKINLFRETLTSKANCLISEWNELSNEKSVELNKMNILYITTPDIAVVNHYLNCLDNFNNDEKTITKPKSEQFYQDSSGKKWSIN